MPERAGDPDLTVGTTPNPTMQNGSWVSAGSGPEILTVPNFRNPGAQWYIGVYGWSTITTAGVYGTSLGGPGVAGNSYGANSYGVTGTSIGGHGVYSSGDLYAPSNSAAYVTFNSPTVSVVLGSNWTNTYGVRIQLIVDGTLNMAVAGSTVLTFTNLTTAESHIVAGTTISIAGTTYFSDNELISKGNIVKYTAANTGTATTSINKTTVKIQ